MKKRSTYLCVFISVLIFLCSCQNVMPPEVPDSPYTATTTEIPPTATESSSDTSGADLDNAEETKYSEGEYNWNITRDKTTGAISGTVKYTSRDNETTTVYSFDIAITDGNMFFSDGYAGSEHQNALSCDVNIGLQVMKTAEKLYGSVINTVTFTQLNSQLLPFSSLGSYSSHFNSSKVTDYYVSSNSELYTSVDGIIFSKDMKTLVAFPPGRSGHYSIPEGVEALADSAFDYCAIEQLTIPKSLKNIGRGLWHALALEVIYFPPTDKQAEIELLAVLESEKALEVRTERYRHITAVYSGNNSDDPAFKHFAIANITKELGTYENGYTANDGVLYIKEGVKALYELDLNELSKTTYKKVVLPSTLRSMSGAYMLNTEEFEVAEANELLMSREGIVYNKARGKDPFRFWGVIIACPTGKTGNVVIEEYCYVAPSAFRNSKLSSVHFVYGANLDAPLVFYGSPQLEVKTQNAVRTDLYR